MLKQLEKEKAWKIGLLQSLLVTLYCGGIAAFFSFLTKAFPKDPPGLFGFFLMLMLLVLSAAATGSLVFGYPAYLVVVQRKIKEAITILAFTFFFSVAIILGTIVFLVTALA